jgi:hypothetical protein
MTRAGSTMPPHLLQAAPPEILAVPSETTWEERTCLYNFFSTDWHGEGDVCEVGPFLGGTTRAIGMGMAANPRRTPASRLCTFDKFDGYYSSAALAEKLWPLIERGEIDPAVVSGSSDTSFRNAFDAIHRGKAYASFLVTTSAVIPDVRDQQIIGTRFAVDPSRPISAVFVDGCKSWYATKFVMSAIAARLEAGAHLIFQDYGFHTCFWIPAFVYAMRDVLALRWAVDYTYAFSLRAPFSAETIAERFADTPEEHGREFFDDVFLALIREADARGDVHGVVAACLQHAGVLAYLGCRREAEAQIVDLGTQTFAAPYKLEIGLALRSPTYRPDGRGGFSELILG